VPVVKVRRRGGAAPSGLLPLSRQRDDAIGTVIAERPQQHRVDHAEDRGVGADAERERANRQQREPGLAAQRARGVAKILKNGVHSVPP